MADSAIKPPLRRRRFSKPLAFLLALVSPLLAAVGAVAVVGCVVTVPEGRRTLQGGAGDAKSVVSEDCARWRGERAQATGGGLDGNRFRVLTWNVHKGRDAGWLEDFLRLAREHDVLALQEAYLTEDLYDALGSEAYNWRLSTAFQLRAVDAGVLTASRSGVEESCSLRHAEPFTRVPKATLATTLVIDGSERPLLLVNLHGVNFTIGTAALESQLNEVAEVLARHDGPVILAGDFNTWSGARRSVLEQTASRLGLRAVEPTDDQRTRFLGHTVDAVYYRGLEVLETATFAVNSSDHNPISVTFRALPTLLARAS